MGFASYPSMLEISQVSGFLFWGTTSLANEAGWGTKLGYVKGGIDWRPYYGTEVLSGVENGDEPILTVFTGNSGRLIALLRNYNTTALARLFPGLVTGTAVKTPGAIAPGTILSATAAYYGRLLFVPDDEDNHPCLLLQKAVPHALKTTKLKFAHADELVFPCVFEAHRKSDDADGISYLGLIAGATLR